MDADSILSRRDGYTAPKETIATRRLLHEHAEPSWEVAWTARTVEERLRSYGYDRVQTYAGTASDAFVSRKSPHGSSSC